MFQFSPDTGGKTARCSAAITFLIVCAAFLFSGVAQAQFHGVAIAKQCSPFVRICDDNSSCDDQNECTDDICDTTNPNTTSCNIRIMHDDEFGDTITVKQAWDVIHAAGGDIRNPAAGNLAVTSFSGNAQCPSFPDLPCTIGPNVGAGEGQVIFATGGYNPTPADGATVDDTGFAVVADLCDAPGTSGCSTADQNIQFGASVVLNDGCSNPNLPDSTPCTDTDGNACTEAGCDGAGVCDQLHVDNTTCADDGNECTGDGTCNPNSGICEYPNLADSTPCTDSDGNACTEAGCDGAGVCDQLHNVTTCGDDGNECTGDGVCNPNDGLCEYAPLASSTPCTDSDGNACTEAGCDGAGTCDQLHVPPPTCEGSPGGAECNVCDPATGACVERSPLPEVCVDEERCRTPGFWGSHGGSEKAPKSQNITQAVIDSVPGGLEVCGTFITNTDLDDSQSAIEAMCVAVKGDSTRQLVRQLTAAALNCAIGDCSADTEALIADCNDTCADGTGARSVNECIDEIDCFNNGGTWDSGFGMCTFPGACNSGGQFCLSDGDCDIGDFCVPGISCHDRDLCPDFSDDGEINGSDLCFEPPGPASSPKTCNVARKNDVYVP